MVETMAEPIPHHDAWKLADPLDACFLVTKCSDCPHYRHCEAMRDAAGDRADEAYERMGDR